MTGVDPMLILNAIGAVILVVGLAMYAVKRKFGGTMALLGVLWLFAMGIYYWFSASGFYSPYGGVIVEKAGYIPNVIGVALLIVGIAIGAYVVGKVKAK